METARNTHTRLRILALAMIAVLLLAACGGSDDDSNAKAANTRNDANTNAVVEANDVADSADTSPEMNESTEDTIADTMSDTAEDAAQPAAPALLPGQRDAPVPINAGFHNDPPSLVGATGNPQLVEFFAYWCTICKSIAPEVHGLEAEYFGAVDFVYLDRENSTNKELVDQFGIFGQPVLVLLDAEGNELQRWFGYVDTNDLATAFDDVLAS